MRVFGELFGKLQASAAQRLAWRGLVAHIKSGQLRRRPASLSDPKHSQGIPGAPAPNLDP